MWPSSRSIGQRRCGLRRSRRSWATPVSTAAYGYDGGFNRVSKVVNGVQETYGYDVLDRLRAATVAAGPRTDWTYDAVGNRLTQQGEGMLTRYTHDAGNRLTSAEGGGTYLFQGTTDEASQVQVNGQPARLLSSNAFEALVPVTAGLNQAVVEATDASGNVRRNEYEFEVEEYRDAAQSDRHTVPRDCPGWRRSAAARDGVNKQGTADRNNRSVLRGDGL
jgi:YD repeat-containing protein